MIIQCENCSRKFVVKDSDIHEEGRMVQCGYCSVTWHQMPFKIPTKPIESTDINETLSVDKIRASDGKTYKFLGSQWAELLPSGKTGLFAKKKIGKELDKLTGRKEKSTAKKRQKKIQEIEINTIEKEIDPSSESANDNKQLPDVYKSGEGLGFFGYIFLLIIVGFSAVGILKTFETDLITRFPEIEYIFEVLDEQLIYIAETVKNIITIFNDLIDSY